MFGVESLLKDQLLLLYVLISFVFIKIFIFMFIKTFKHNMDSKTYYEIINDYIFNFMAINFNFSGNLHQDNDSKHSSLLCRTALEDLNINWVPIKKTIFS